MMAGLLMMRSDVPLSRLSRWADECRKRHNTRWHPITPEGRISFALMRTAMHSTMSGVVLPLRKAAAVARHLPRFHEFI